MYTFDVLVSKGELSDGSTCYAAWCSYLYGVWGQGETEEEALTEVTLMMTDVVNDPEDLAESLVNPEDAANEMADMIREYETESTPCWTGPIYPARYTHGNHGRGRGPGGEQRELGLVG